MNIKQNNAEVFNITTPDGWDSATIFLQEGKDKQGNHWGCISIVSSYGKFGHFFGNMGQPLKSFLANSMPSYLMHKMTDGHDHVFDKEQSILHIRNLIAKYSPTNKKSELNITLDEIEDEEDTVDGLGRALSYNLPELWEEHALWENFAKYKTCPQIDGFITNIWKPFVAEIKSEN